MRDNHLISIAICTYKRAHLKNTLLSVFNSTNVDIPIDIIIIDNDAEQSGQVIVEEIDIPINFTLSYYSEPQKGVVYARNKALIEATTPWLMFIDDDELVESNWLSEYINLINDKSIQFDACIGPVITTYDESVDRIIVESTILDRKRFPHRGSIVHGATGNCLFNLPFIKEHKISFDIIFNTSGGEDSDFFEKIANKGNVIWNDLSVVYEALTPERASKEWILKRFSNNGFYYGQRKIMRIGYRYIPYLFCSSVIKLLKDNLSYLMAYKKRAEQFYFRCQIARDLGRIRICFKLS